MMGSCPRCSVQVPGWLYYEPPLVICLSCGAVIRDDTKANRYNDWDYKSGKHHLCLLKNPLNEIIPVLTIT